MSDKDTGSFYTPIKLIEYMIGYVKERVSFEKVLEPSAGDGRFILKLKQFSQEITAIEFDQAKVNNLRRVEQNNVIIKCADYIEYSLQEEKRYSLIIGNPPYISKSKTPKRQREKSIELAHLFNLSESLLQNLWVSFILASLKVLDDNGAVFFVLPFEFLQVQYAEKLRTFLEGRFNTIEITTFQEPVFSEIDQDVCLVYLSNEKIAKPFIKYTTIKSIDTQEKIFESVIMRNKPLKKWSNCILDDDETECLKKISERYPKIETFGEISPGIVTGGNSFFIIDKEHAIKLEIKDEALKIISKSADLQNKFIFDGEDYLKLADAGKEVYLINLNGKKTDTFSPELKAYLKAGKRKKLHKRYKCKIRKRWFDVPVVKNGDACFFKRFHLYPKLVLNRANVYTTDIAYNIRFYEGLDPASFVFSFYNSLTLALCEYSGRFYGGGVGELVPSEFKALAIPYKNIQKENLTHVDKMIRAGDDFSSVVDYIDNIVLDLDDDERRVLKNIRNRFIQRRLSETV